MVRVSEYMNEVAHLPSIITSIWVLPDCTKSTLFGTVALGAQPPNSSSAANRTSSASFFIFTCSLYYYM
ncbi:MAG TPA: hypothetical protein PLP19_19615 [bacterium]|nr:hypothetical protein [bacterium]HPN45704.1 hypothetical protein [bacterium]